MMSRMGLPVESLSKKTNHFVSEAQDKYRSYVVAGDPPEMMTWFADAYYEAQPPEGKDAHYVTTNKKEFWNKWDELHGEDEESRQARLRHEAMLQRAEEQARLEAMNKRKKKRRARSARRPKAAENQENLSAPKSQSKRRGGLPKRGQHVKDGHHGMERHHDKDDNDERGRRSHSTYERKEQ